eukprot:14190689-Ditylum_brightwellii.AAC.1
MRGAQPGKLHYPSSFPALLNKGSSPEDHNIFCVDISALLGNVVYQYPEHFPAAFVQLPIFLQAQGQ